MSGKNPCVFKRSNAAFARSRSPALLYMCSIVVDVTIFGCNSIFSHILIIFQHLGGCLWMKRKQVKHFRLKHYTNYKGDRDQFLTASINYGDCNVGADGG
ncbi:hypothetical protein HAX54_001491 [Datura stramonium]|uniref:Uncharacterized protein n=1 Tax=Datura stramonium TaxID=4076 RepID=A0ABS8T396_DATST|nr:hypothetical protein [Datura stramonium]